MLHVNLNCEIARTKSLQLLIAFETPLRGNLKFVNCVFWIVTYFPIRIGFYGGFFQVQLKI